MLLSGGFIVALIVLVLAIGGIIGGIVWNEHDEGGYWGPVPASLTGVSITLVALLAIGLFPWTPSYHTLQEHSGQIVRVEQRYVTDGTKSANITKEMAFWLSGEKEAYQTDDIRFQGLKAGDFVEIRRQKHWVYGGQNYWNATLLDAGK